MTVNELVLYNLKEMPLSAELFVSCSILQLTFYAIGIAYSQKSKLLILTSLKLSPPLSS